MKTKSTFVDGLRTTITGWIKLSAYFIFRFYLFITHQQIKVRTIEASIKVILKDRVSIGRFGDGEFKWMFKEREPDNFEKNSPALASALLNVIQTEREGFQVCIPNVFSGLSQYRRLDTFFWAGQLGHHGYQWIRTLNPRKTYLDSLVTRPYMIYKDRTQGRKLFRLIKEIWQGRNIILVEGSETRFGIGNDLLENANTVKRIICPSENAFEQYGKILDIVVNVIEASKDPDILILVSLGPTATVLANDVNLKTSVQVLDIGHLDVEYSWMLMKVDKKVPVEYKYVNEVINGNKVQGLPSRFLNQYDREIVAKIK
ncbi:GT-D fold domain-containing glycosyltransferase [Lacticaseibacillus paracasei]|uniref:GT-D fold domain-containing glycosyltransferase n=1 Tax=Lacticaseibacillus paracasei TaxID=1597 RepID=UPI00029836B2|nr:GT-D fold domain-containing glycosyltransferase [Lacticaseibacillus paracasei]EKQ05933.1 glycosyltransferase [Lacticaseibacillus paracasei]NMN62753.1 glycosyltransferase family protein [Lacticaseibacillus casei]NMN66589.1 glycosyltransferase family protein [Lacticaseibacillus casei CRF28]